MAEVKSFLRIKQQREDQQLMQRLANERREDANLVLSVFPDDKDFMRLYANLAPYQNNDSS